jgi:hypothetical protein
MTAIRHDGPTPAGGDHTISVHLDEVDEAVAARIGNGEYGADGTMIAETIGVLNRSQLPAPSPAASEAELKAAGIELDGDGTSTVTFVGPDGLAAARKLSG